MKNLEDLKTRIDEIPFWKEDDKRLIKNFCNLAHQMGESKGLDYAEEAVNKILSKTV